MRSLTRLFVVVLFLSLLSTQSYGVTRTWLNAGSGSWTNTVNWSGGVLPVTLDTAVIDNGGTAVFPIAGSASIYELTIGNAASGTLQMDGGSFYAQFTDIGVTGTGTLDMNAGALSSVNATIAGTLGSSGTATVSGGSWDLSSELRIGYVGNGGLTVDGGTVTSRSGILGVYSGSSGVATVSGGTWNNTFLEVGSRGTGTLNVSGGTVTGSVFVGDMPGASGVVNVTSGALNAGSLNVGSLGHGELTLSGGTITDSFTYIAGVNGSVGNVTVTNGTWTNVSGLHVGQNGNGTLTISGGDVSNNTGYIAYTVSATGTATVSGGIWRNTNELNVGYGGTGKLTITGTGQVEIANGTGTLNLASSQSNGTLNLGDGGVAGTLLAGRVFGKPFSGAPRAVVNFGETGTYTFAPNLEGNLIVNQIGSGTTILTGNSSYTGKTAINSGIVRLGSANAISKNAGNAISFGGGILQYTATNTYDYSSQFSQAASQARRIHTNGQTITFATALNSAGGSLEKLGSGMLTLTASNSFTGATTITAGTLLLSGSGSVAGSSAIKVASGATFDVSNVLLANTYSIGSAQLLSGGGVVNVGGAGKTLSVHGNIEPGVDSPGVGTTLNVLGNLLLESDSEVHLSIYGSGANDSIAVGNTLAYGGMLVLDIDAPVTTGSNILFTFASLPTLNWTSVGLTGSYSGALALNGNVWTGSLGNENFTFDSDTGVLNYAPIPEPSVFVLLGLGMIFLVVCRRAFAVWR